MRPALAAAATFATLAGAGRAFAALPANTRMGGADIAPYQDPAVMLSGKVIPLSPMKPGLRELKIVPAYVETDVQENFSSSAPPGGGGSTGGSGDIDTRAKGAGLAVSFFSAWSERWGWSVQGTAVKWRGSGYGLEETAGGRVIAHRTDDKALVTMGLGTIVFDPLGGKGGRFNLPVYAGYGVLHQKLDSKAKAYLNNVGAQVRFEADVDPLAHGPVLGGSVQMAAGDFRFAPYISMMLNFAQGDSESRAINAATGALLERRTGLGGDERIIAGGIAASYVPWGLTFSYNPALMKEGRIFSISLSKTFSWTKSS